MSFASNIIICHHCPNRQPHCQGACYCTVSGKDIMEHARVGCCPINKFQSAEDRKIEPTATKRCACSRKQKVD